MVTRSKSGKPLIMTGVSFDVTSMKKGTEKALIKLNEELSRSNQELQQFANIASHDLQEPLRMVSSFTQLLQQRYKDKLDKDANEYINFAIEGSRRMYEMINSLLAYSRVQTRGKEFDIVNMNDVIEKVSGNLSITIREKKAVLNHDDLPIVFADENQMIQLMQNLVDNGIKFSKDYPKIIVSSRSEDNYNIISVKDEGIGIEPQYFDRIFKIFQRLHCSGSYKGTGIGLAICKRIIERHEGKIWLDSQPGKGSTFYFSIPKKRL